ncbi:MAG: hypothetical protein AcusKO_13540 [Acuticoccus sp.]
MPRYHVSVLEDTLEPMAWLHEIAPGSDTGAIASFVGLCRSEDGRLAALELEHYPGMAEAQMTQIAEEALRRWPLHGMLAVHRTGLVKVGEPIVFVAAGSSHRDAAFEAVRFMMDFLKTEAPFWKREHLVGGTVGRWIEARARDDRAAAAWG